MLNFFTETRLYVRESRQNILLSTQGNTAAANSQLQHVAVFTGHVFFHISGMKRGGAEVAAAVGRGVLLATTALMNIYKQTEVREVV